MPSKIKIKKLYVYDGLGFPIILKQVTMIKVRNEWVPKIDVEDLSDLMFKLLPSKPSKLTGNEIKFLRTYLNKSKLAFAQIFMVSHTAVSKWEKSGDHPAPIEPSLEKDLRLYMKDLLNDGDEEFHQLWRDLKQSVHNRDMAPLKVAL